MYELHENEQYFFDGPTLDHLASFLSHWENPCYICAPLLGKKLQSIGVDVTILDVDERFATVPGFRRFDLHRPEWLGDTFDIVLCDPPFYSVSLSRLFAALRVLSQNDFTQNLMVSYLTRRSGALLGTFSKFGLRPSGYLPQYQTVQRVQRNEIEFYTNLKQEDVRRLGTDE